MIGLLFHIVPFIECRQLTVSTVNILTCSALFCLVHILCSVTIKAPHISHETVLHAATLSFYSVCERRTRNRQRGYYNWTANIPAEETRTPDQFFLCGEKWPVCYFFGLLDISSNTVLPSQSFLLHRTGQ